MVPGYEGVVLIGEGGLGRVYRATRVSTGGTVAIKELHDVAQASPSWHRAMREVEAMLRLKGHPNVVSVEEVVQGPNGPCIVMEFLSGGSLHDRLQRGHLSVPEVVLVGQHVAGALAAAHGGGVIHRDVKPHNLLVSGFGHVKVADFGIAALLRAAGGKTQTQSLTLAYASPEELDGVVDVGPATDVYSLAATLAHLVTGLKPSFRDRSLASLPFDGEPALVHVGQALRRSLVTDPLQRPLMTELVALFDDAQVRLGSRRLASLTPATAISGVQGATIDADEATARRQVAAATIIQPRQPAPPPPPPAPPPPPPPPPVATVAPLVVTSTAPRPTRGRTVPIAIAAVFAALVVGGIGFFVAGRDSSSNEPSSFGSPTPTSAASSDTAGAADSESAPTSDAAVPATSPATTVAVTQATVPPTEPTVATTVPLDPDTAALIELQRLINQDAPLANSLVGYFVPQLSAKYIGLEYQGITYGPVEVLGDHLGRRDDYGAILVDSGAFQFENDGRPMVGWFLSIVPVVFSTKAEATQWCDSRGLGKDDCFGREFKPAR